MPRETAKVEPVVVGFDTTQMGRRVVERGRLVAEGLGAPLELVHALEPMAESMIPKNLVSILRRHQRETALQLETWCRERATVPVRLTVVNGSPSWELVRRSKSATMVVVGSSSIDAFAAGPVAERVVRMAGCDVLVVRRQPRVPYRRVVAGVDFSEASRLAVVAAQRYFPNAEVTAVYSLDARFEPLMVQAGLFSEEVESSRAVRLEAARDRMEEFVSQWDGAVRSMVADGTPSSTIDEVVRRRGADLVTVASRGASATRMVLLGSTAAGLVAHSPCDVLVARSRGTFRRP